MEAYQGRKSKSKPTAALVGLLLLIVFLTELQLVTSQPNENVKSNRITKPAHQTETQKRATTRHHEQLRHATNEHKATQPKQPHPLEQASTSELGRRKSARTVPDPSRRSQVPRFSDLQRGDRVQNRDYTGAKLGWPLTDQSLLTKITEENLKSDDPDQSGQTSRDKFKKYVTEQSIRAGGLGGLSKPAEEGARRDMDDDEPLDEDQMRLLNQMFQESKKTSTVASTEEQKRARQQQEQQDRVRRQEQDRVRRQEQERVRRQEQDRVRRQSERVRRQEQDRVRRQESDRVRRQQDSERVIRQQEQDRVKRQQESERLRRQEESERLRRQEDRLRRQQEDLISRRPQGDRGRRVDPTVPAHAEPRVIIKKQVRPYVPRVFMPKFMQLAPQQPSLSRTLNLPPKPQSVILRKVEGKKTILGALPQPITTTAVPFVRRGRQPAARSQPLLAPTGRRSGPSIRAPYVEEPGAGERLIAPVATRQPSSRGGQGGDFVEHRSLRSNLAPHEASGQGDFSRQSFFAREPAPGPGPSGPTYQPESPPPQQNPSRRRNHR